MTDRNPIYEKGVYYKDDSTVYRSHPTDRQACIALLLAVSQHRAVRNANIFHPLTKEVVRIQELKTFGGPELLEGGLALAVYPVYTSFIPFSGAVPSTRQQYSIEYSEGYKSKPVFGPSSDINTPSVHRYVIQLFYQDVTTLSDETSAYYYNVPLDLMRDLPQGEYSGHFETDNPNKLAASMPYLSEVRFTISPGEDILRDWMYLLRQVVKDIEYFKPYSYFRNPFISFVDYPTTSWLKDGGKPLIFHTAYMVVEFQVEEPPIRPDKIFPPPTEFEISP